MKELDTMKQLKPHPYVIKLLECVTESGMLWLCGSNFAVHILLVIDNLLQWRSHCFTIERDKQSSHKLILSFLANIDALGFTDRLKPNICHWTDHSVAWAETLFVRKYLICTFLRDRYIFFRLSKNHVLFSCDFFKSIDHDWAIHLFSLELFFFFFKRVRYHLNVQFLQKSCWSWLNTCLLGICWVTWPRYQTTNKSDFTAAEEVCLANCW